MNEAVLLFGCNLGSCEATFKEAIDLITESDAEIIKHSSLYSTAPWGKQDQPPFLNQVVQIKTNLKPDQLLKKIAAVENKLGRTRIEINGPRTIDIDILFFNDLEVITNDLIIPHPRLHLRKFTLIPLNEIIPDYLHPTLNKSIRDLLKACDDELQVTRLVNIKE